MKKSYAIVLLCVLLSLTGCTQTDSEENSSESDFNTSTSVEASVSIESEEIVEEIPQIIIEGSDVTELSVNEEGVIFPTGVIEEVTLQLPGYENVLVEKELFHAELQEIFMHLGNVKKPDDTLEFSFLDGVQLKISYKVNDKYYYVVLSTRYNMKTVTVSISSDKTLFYEEILSTELSQAIHDIAQWEEFALEGLNEVDTMEICLGEQSVIISEEQTRDILDRIQSCAEKENWDGCPYNIKVRMFDGDEEIYNARLSGDSCPCIGIEYQYFGVDGEIIQEMYDAIDYDVSVDSN